MYSVVRIYLLLLYGTPVSLNQHPPPRPPAPKFPGVCKAQLYVVYHSHHSLVFLHWSCNLWYTPSLHFLPSPLSLGCASLYHSHHFLSFCMLHFAVLAYYNLQNTTNPSPTSPPPNSLGCVHLYHSHHFLVLLQAVLCC